MPCVTQLTVMSPYLHTHWFLHWLEDPDGDLVPQQRRRQNLSAWRIGGPADKRPALQTSWKAGFTFLSQCRILITCGRTLIASWREQWYSSRGNLSRAVLLDSGPQGSMDGGFLCYVPTLSNLINSQASNHHPQQGISACPCEAVSSPPGPTVQTWKVV